jgi:hypothetical protein
VYSQDSGVFPRASAPDSVLVAGKGSVKDCRLTCGEELRAGRTLSARRRYVVQVERLFILVPVLRIMSVEYCILSLVSYHLDKVGAGLREGVYKDSIGGVGGGKSKVGV